MAFTSDVRVFTGQGIDGEDEIQTIYDNSVDLIEQSRFSGVSLTASGTLSSGGSSTEISWDSESFDVGNWWSSGTDIVVPSGVSYVEIIAQIEWEQNISDMILFSEINGSFPSYGGFEQRWTAPKANAGCTSIIPVSAADVITILIRQSDGANRDYDATVSVRKIG